MLPKGIVYLVGAGPGDAGLLTLRGAELLGRADVVICDGLVNRELIRLAPAAAEIIYGGKHDRARCISQDELSALLLARARKGKCVVRLKAGDPCAFGRGGEEAEFLAEADIPFEVVPGVSSVHSVPCCAGIPLTRRNHTSAVTVVTGHEPPSAPTNKLDWAQLAKIPGTLVVLMGLKNISEIAMTLMTHGRSPGTPAAIISRGATARQKTVVGDLSNIADLLEQTKLSPPAITVIGDVVNFRKKLNWFEQRPLFGRRVVVTQRGDLVRPLAVSLREQGAEVLEVPATHWGPPVDMKPLDEALTRLKTYDWILFSNPIGMDVFFERFFRIHADLRRLGGVRLGTYGPVTGRKLRDWHLQPAAVAADHKTPLIMKALTECGGVRGQKFLLLRGESGWEKVPEALAESGAFVDVVPSYSAEPETDDASGDAARLIEEGADWIVFASGLAIKHFHVRFDLPKLMARFPNTRLAIASITIKWALDELGLEPSVVAQPNNVESVTNGIAEFETEKHS